MAKLHHSGTAQETALRQAAVSRGMIDDLGRTIQILNIDISSEEERVRVFDRSDPAYPILARTLTARRDNLIVTVADLRERLREVRCGCDAERSVGLAGEDRIRTDLICVEVCVISGPFFIQNRK